MTNSEIVELIKEMLGANAIGLFSLRIDNGADCIVCPSCQKSTRVMGNAYGQHALTDGEHYDGCQFMKLADAIAAGASDDEIVDRTAALIDDDAIGAYGHSVTNGGDFIQCPACSATQKVMGYAGSLYPLDAIDNHEAVCDAIKLAEAIRAARR